MRRYRGPEPFVIVLWLIIASLAGLTVVTAVNQVHTRREFIRTCTDLGGTVRTVSARGADPQLCVSPEGRLLLP